MAEQKTFRSAFNGFNREDVVRYIDFLNTRHKSQINQMTSEMEFLRNQLSKAQVGIAPTAPDQTTEELMEQLEKLRVEKAELELQAASAMEEVARMRVQTTAALASAMGTSKPAEEAAPAAAADEELTAQLQQLQDEKAALEAQAQQLQDEKAALEAQVDELLDKNAELEAQLADEEEEEIPAEEAPAEEAEPSQLEEEIAQLQEQNAALEEELAQLREQNAALEAQAAENAQENGRLKDEAAAALAAVALAESQRDEALRQTAGATDWTSQELEAYRRAERAERMAMERAERLHRQTNGIIADASAQVEEAAGQIGSLSEQCMAQLEQLQNAVLSSREALRTAAATIQALCPEEEA